uniref:Transcription factor IIIB 50 kDa subunit n=2 Tax=Latimeria chalumnae TaxID=7897 RepID=H3AZX7_LATCH
MSEQKQCPECGSSEIVEDAHYSQNQLVCVECGYVLTEGLLTTTLSDETHFQVVRFTQSTEQTKQPTRSKIRGLKRVRDLCKILCLPYVCEEKAVSYYQRAFDHPSYHTVRVEKKEILVGCCVYVSCRQHNWPLTVSTICSLLHADKGLFTTVFLNVIKEFELDVPAQSLTDLVKTYCDSFQVFQNSRSVPPKFVEEKEKVVQRASQIVELASETWLVTGRHPIPIIIAASYLAWQSLRPADRLSCSLLRFCKLAGVDFPSPASLRLKEISEVLAKLASQLAWLRVLNLNKKTVVKYIGDILHHRIVLLRNAIKSTFDATAAGHSCANEESTQDEPETTPGTSETTDLLTGAPSRKGDVDLTSKRKALLFLPPCLLNPKKKTRNSEELNSTELNVTGDEDISDSEIEQYLRTPEEIKVFQRAHNAVGLS